MLSCFYPPKTAWVRESHGTEHVFPSPSENTVAMPEAVHHAVQMLGMRRIRRGCRRACNAIADGTAANFRAQGYSLAVSK